MTKRHLVWFLLAALVAVPALAQEGSADMTVDDIIAKNLETLGGKDAWKAVQSARISATLDTGTMQLPVTLEFKRPRMFRMETEVQGMKMIQAYDGEKGWGVMPMMGKTEPEYLADDQLKQLEEQSDFDGPLMDYKDKGHTVELLGKEDVEGTEAYKLKVTLKSGDVITMYLDTEYCLIFKEEAKISMQGNELNATVTYSDYKPVGDIVMAHSIERIFEGAPAGITITFNEVDLGVDVDDSSFAFPEPPAEEETAEE